MITIKAEVGDYPDIIMSGQRSQGVGGWRKEIHSIVNIPQAYCLPTYPEAQIECEWMRADKPSKSNSTTTT